MKKVALLGFILSATAATWASAETAPSSVCPKAFQGFHIGGNIGYGVGWAKQRITSTTTNNFVSIRNDLGVRGVDGGIGTGYLHRFGHWGVGLGFDANWASTKGTVTASTRNALIGTGSLTGRARLRNSLQLFGKIGYVLCGEQVMPFFGLGWDNSKWQHKITSSQSGFRDFSPSHNKRYNAFLWKAGVDFLATKHVVVGFEYTGTEASRKTFNRRDNVQGETIRASFKPQYNKFALTARVVY